MSWKFNWVSSFNTDFNFDFSVSFTPEQIESGVLPYNYGRFKMKIDELLADVAEVAAFLASDRAGAITASVANLTCGAITD
jgi:predicted dithiol-disulfide oxidoreductase (DUF899 family)